VNNRPSSHSRRRRLTAGLLAAALLITHLAGCGGGVDSGGTGIIASGPISGLGSIFVNDVRFDDDSAEIRDEQGALLTKDQLKLGMTVIVEGGTLDTSGTQATSTALAIRVVSDLVGPVASVDAFPCGKDTAPNCETPPIVIG